MPQEQTKRERFDALQQQLYRAWDRVHRLETDLLAARRETERLLFQKADLLREDD